MGGGCRNPKQETQKIIWHCRKIANGQTQGTLNSSRGRDSEKNATSQPQKAEVSRKYFISLQHRLQVNYNSRTNVK